MQEISLTIFNRGDGGALIRVMLDEFERLYKIHVNLEILDWGPGWTKLVNCALYANGPDLSEVGSTWVMDFVRMNAVSGLSPLEMAQIGSEQDFFPTNWYSGVVKDPTGRDSVVWGIPWTADVRMAYYRRDLFEKAHIDAPLAFKHTDSLNHAIHTVQAKYPTPALALGTILSYNNLHILASWIWDAGGDLIALNGNRVAFDSLNALQGIYSYFKLGQYLPVERRKIVDIQVDQFFLSGESAVIFSGYWIVRDLALGAPIIRENMGLAAMPGASFVGGTHLLAWKHSPKREQSLMLIDFLAKHSAEHHLFPKYGLPAYVPSWQKFPLFGDAHAAALFDALQKGRSFPVSPLWGLVEKRLTDAIPIFWEKVWDQDEKDLEKTLADMIVPLARRINITLE